MVGTIALEGTYVNQKIFECMQERKMKIDFNFGIQFQNGKKNVNMVGKLW